MNPDAKVELFGAPVGKVSSIVSLPDDQAAIHLAIDPSALHIIPSNIRAQISSTTAFGAKYVQLEVPNDPSPQSLRAGQVLQADHVTVEINTVFAQLTSVLTKIKPEKLNETLGALASGFNGRGQKFGQILSDFDALLAKLEPHLPALSHDLAVAPPVLRTYGDVAPDLMRIIDNAASFSRTVVDEQHHLDALLLSATGLADVGTPVLDANRQPLTDVLHLLVPTSQLLYDYRAALWCGLAGLLPVAQSKPLAEPGIPVIVGLVFGDDRYRYPSNLPKIAASGGPQCTGLPKVPYNTIPPFVVTDTGANPWQYGNPGVVLNFDGITRALFGPADGPPRNTAQIGQPG